MSNGGSLIDRIRRTFSSGGGSRDGGATGRDPVEERLERVEQIASGVEMAAAALSDEMKQLRRDAVGAAEAVHEAARARAPRRPDRDEPAAGASSPEPEALDALSRCVDALEDLHYRLLRIEVHPELSVEEERERAAEAAREAVEEARAVADSLSEAAAA